jgi:CheY-like chemotaxis protein
MLPTASRYFRMSVFRVSEFRKAGDATGLLEAPRGAGSAQGTDAALLERVVKAPLKILAVDNEPSITLSLSYIFEGPRYELTGVESAQAALAGLDLRQYDVIIVDQKMPQLTGVELVGEIRKRGVSGKIMVLSAQLSPEVRDAYERMDVHVMLAKPFDISDLRSAVDRLAA